VTWLRAARRVVDPGGRTWELYVTRARIRPWQAVTPEDGLPAGQEAAAGVDVWFLLVPVFVVIELVVGILRLIALVPLSLAGVALRQRLRVEAIAEHPTRLLYAWEVERATLDQVLDEIAAGLARGSIVQPAHARFLGETE
jgi:hypothetical protein